MHFKQRSSLFVFLFCVLIAYSCTTTKRQLVKEVNRNLITSHSYFQKKIPLMIWRAKTADKYGWRSTNTLFSYDINSLTAQGYLRLADSIPSPLFPDFGRPSDLPGYRVFYEVTEKGKPYLTSLHLDSTYKKPDTAWFNAYSLKTMTLDTFYNDISDRIIDPQTNSLMVYKDVIKAVFRCAYNATPLFMLPQNPRNMSLYFKTENNGKTWRLQDEYMRRYMIIGVYSPLQPLNTCTDYYEDNVVFPPELKVWLEQYWLSRLFSSWK